jgi:rRNA maturation RNase YbeY
MFHVEHFLPLRPMLPAPLPDSVPSHSTGLTQRRTFFFDLVEPCTPATLPGPFAFILHAEALTAWLNALADDLALAPDFEITYVFLDDAGILEINREHLEHDYYTDIITFDHTNDSTPCPLSDIFISLERVLDNATTLNLPPDEELRRVMIHGLLHLAGEEDATDEQEARMRAREDDLLHRFPFPPHETQA